MIQITRETPAGNIYAIYCKPMNFAIYLVLLSTRVSRLMLLSQIGLTKYSQGQLCPHILCFIYGYFYFKSWAVVTLWITMSLWLRSLEHFCLLQKSNNLIYCLVSTLLYIIDETYIRQPRCLSFLVCLLHLRIISVRALTEKWKLTPTGSLEET